MKLDTFSADDIKQKIREITDAFKAKGWDYVVEYQFHVSASSAKEALKKILDQSARLTPEAFSLPLRGPVDRAGIGASFGGLKSTEYPFVEQLMATQEYGPENKEWEAAREDVQTTMFLDGITEAENLAKDYVTKKLRGPLKERFRVFQCVLIPVMSDAMRDTSSGIDLS